MKTSILACLAIAAAVALAMTVASAEDQPVREFELTIGETVHPVDLDRPFTIPGPDGKPVTAVLRRAAGVFAGHGIQFRYPSAMKVTEEPARGRVMVTLEGPTGTFIKFQIFSPEVSKVQRTDSVQDLMVGAIKGNLVKAGVTFPEGTVKTSKRTIGKLEWTGHRLDYELGPDRFVTEIYTFELGDQIISAIFQNDSAQAALMKEAVDLLAGSFRKQ